MRNFKENDIIKVKITGIQKYGAFARLENDYNGLIHISEISYGYVRNINDFVNVGDNIYAEIVNIDNDAKQIKLSIKNIDYKNDGGKLKKMAETKRGFKPLQENLELWINKRIKEITDNF
jgi:general stress protein 13